MGEKPPVEKLSDVLSDLQGLQQSGRPLPPMDHQIETLRGVQEQMLAQLRLHDAQIAALREVIALLSGDE